MLSGPPLLFRFLNPYTLLVACIVILCIHLWTFHDTGFRFINNALAAPASSAFAATIAQDEQEYKGIPRKLWYKLGPHGMSDEIRDRTKTCVDNNPGYDVEFMTDETGDELFKKVFASRPDIVEGYLALPIPIIKADILRYVLLYHQGGVWSDLDISCEGVPIDDWVPEQYREAVDLVVGWEFDWGLPGKYMHQLASWTIMAKKGSLHMLQVINDTFETLHETLEENDVAVQNLTLKMVGDVVDFSGPRRLTRSVYKSLSTQLNRTIGEDDLSYVLHPRLVHNVLVMPGRSFADSANYYTPDEEAQLPPKLVHHHYAGSWKNDHGGEE